MSGDHSPESNRLTRRDFIRLLGAFGGAAVTAGVLPHSVDALQEANLQTPEIQNGIEVYGLNSPIDSVEKFVSLKNSFTNAFENNVNSKKTLIEQTTNQSIDFPHIPAKRDFLYGSSKRRVEYVIRKSDFLNDPITNQNITNRLKIQTKLMNRMLENSDPSIEMDVEIARVVIVDDKYTFIPDGGLKTAHDIDCSEFVGGTERGSKFLAQPPGEFSEQMTLNSDSKGNVLAKWKQGRVAFTEEVYLPNKKLGSDTSLSNLKDFPISTFDLHEGIHRWLGELFDPYTSDILNVDSQTLQFSKFKVYEGEMISPQIQPLAAMLIKWNKENGVRGMYDHPLSQAAGQEVISKIVEMKPDSISVNIPNASEIKIYRQNLKNGYYDRNNQTLDSYPSLVSKGELSVFDKFLFEPRIWHEPWYIDVKEQKTHKEGKDIEVFPTSYVIETSINGEQRVFFLPVSVFIMSKLAGISTANYKIEIESSPRLETKTQYTTIIKESELKQFKSSLFQKSHSGAMEAKMKIDGTDCYLVWFQLNTPTANIPSLPGRSKEPQ